MEVRAPRSRFRVDVAAMRLDRMEGEPMIAVFECKQSREDLDRDNQRHLELQARLKALQERREKLERLLAVHYPSLRTSDSLFPEWATFDFSAIDHAAYRQITEKITRIHRQLFGNTKFDLMTRYKLGNLHYLVTTPELLTNAKCRSVGVCSNLLKIVRSLRSAHQPDFPESRRYFGWNELPRRRLFRAPSRSVNANSDLPSHDQHHRDPDYLAADRSSQPPASIP